MRTYLGRGASDENEVGADSERGPRSTAAIHRGFGAHGGGELPDAAAVISSLDSSLASSVPIEIRSLFILAHSPRTR